MARDILTGTLGIMNAKKTKPPKPEASPKTFTWTFPNQATDAQRQALAASLQELLPEKQWTHVNLAKELWGTDSRDNARGIGKARDWVKAVGRYPDEQQAAYVAQLLGVSMQRLTEPKGAFNPTPDFVRPMKEKSEWNMKGGKGKGKHKGNGHDDSDTRWILPEGVDPPLVKLETSKKHVGYMLVDIKGEMPAEVGLAVMAMMAAKRVNE